VCGDGGGGLWRAAAGPARQCTLPRRRLEGVNAVENEIYVVYAPAAKCRARVRARRPINRLFSKVIALPEAISPKIYKIRGLPFSFFMRRGISATELLR
jgi:hypothetical protein